MLGHMGACKTLINVGGMRGRMKEGTGTEMEVRGDGGQDEGVKERWFEGRAE